MLNIPDHEEMSAERFIHICSKMMANWGMPLTSGRVLSYLYLQSEPVGLDQIAAALEISKASAWGAARHLEGVKQLERLGAPGSKRALFVVTGDMARSMFNYSRLLSRMGILMSQAVGAASGEAAAERLQARSDLYLAVHDAIDETVSATIARRRRSVVK